jgi:hypothetical protein
MRTHIPPPLFRGVTALRGLFVRVPKGLSASNRQLTRRRTQPLFSAAIMRTIMLGNSSGVTAPGVLRHEC